MPFYVLYLCFERKLSHGWFANAARANALAWIGKRRPCITLIYSAERSEATTGAITICDKRKLAVAEI